MDTTHRLYVEELKKLESCLSVLIPAAREMRETAPEADFFRAEVPLAIEDVREVLQRLYSFVPQREGAGLESDRVAVLPIRKTSG